MPNETMVTMQLTESKFYNLGAGTLFGDSFRVIRLFCFKKNNWPKSQQNDVIELKSNEQQENSLEDLACC